MEEEKKEMREKEEKDKNKEGKHMGEGIFISKKSLWLMAGGALGAIAAIGFGKASHRIKPALVGAVKEGYAFKEWASAKAEKIKEDVEDIVAEAKYAYHKDLEASAEAVKKEKAVLQKVEETVQKKIAKKKAKKGGA